ncbi:MAG: glutamate-1-semialdehyde 2,1-aminomutase [Acidobacteriota bacterium]|nr:glutamate-1-semialdehyde 2,1-aminomutase [Acidobacteriota bacterium]
MNSPKTDLSDKSEELFARAQELLPGGVNSPVRAFRSVGGNPRFIASAKGAMMTDVDGKTYIDYVGSWGPMILGHADDEVIEAIRQAAEQGTSYGAPSLLEVAMAEEIISAVPSVEMVRMVNSGTEATMSAIRLARGATGREKIVKFEGCYHGHGDSFLVKAGSGVATLGLPDSPGVPQSVAANTLTVPYNSADALETIFDANKGEIAAVIIEPVVGNMGCVAPREDYLQAVRETCTRHGALLIFDEVMTGFRLARGGAQERFGVLPDITTLGKIIGGGLPVGAYGASKDLMRNIAPAGTIYQAGTLSGNPLAMSAGLATLKRLRDGSIYESLEQHGSQLESGLRAAAEENGFRVQINRVGSMITLFFTEEPVFDWETANKSNREMFGKFFHAMLNEGVYLPPSQFEAAFFGIKHTEEIISQTIEAARRAFAQIK